MSTLLMPLPASDFDPTESAVPFEVLKAAGHRLVVATPDGRPATCDPIMYSGQGLGPLAGLLKAAPDACLAYDQMIKSPEFTSPLAWEAVEAAHYDALLLVGGHAPGMRTYIDSPLVQNMVRFFFESQRPVAAICHGVLVAARTRRADGRSVLYGKRSTSLLKSQELLAWNLTRAWMGNYYRTYDLSVEEEVRAALAGANDFITGPMPLLRDSAQHRTRGFVVRDGNYLSARWPGDAWAFSYALTTVL